MTKIIASCCQLLLRWPWSIDIENTLAKHMFNENEMEY